MNACGMIYHCRECNSRLIVDYKDGVRATFIGDLNVYRQRSLSKFYENTMADIKNSLKNPYENYLHDEALCESCYRKLEYPRDMIDKFDRLFEALGAVSSTISGLIEFINTRKKSIIEDYCSTLEFEQARYIDERSFASAFGAVKKPFKKAVNKFIALASDVIVSLFLDRIAFDSEVQLAYAEAVSKASEHRAIALSLSHLCGKLYYSFTNVYSPQNLHFMFVTEFSVREPIVVSDKPIYYYYPCRIDRNNFDEILNRVDRQYTIDQIQLDKNDWVKAVKKRLMKFCDG
jgi:hypothetical protein